MRYLIGNIAVLCQVLSVILSSIEGHAFGRKPFRGMEIKDRLPDGITDFVKIRTYGYLYVDKTMFIEKMLETGYPFYFLARPRKFGKSLFCRTLESLSWGDKDLFHDLAIASSTYDWQVHPVIYLSFASIGKYSETSRQYATAIVDKLMLVPEAIVEARKDKLRNCDVRIHASPGRNESDVSTSLTNLVRSLKRAYSSTPTIIIDEYDSGLTENLKNPEIWGNMSLALREFYACIKDLEPELNFVFITGVARFAQSYLFSSMNNLRDISLNYEYADALGFTMKEMKHFDYHIEKVVEYKKKEWREQVNASSEMDGILKRYNGYTFTKRGPPVFHPSFLMKYLVEMDHGVVGSMIPDPKFLFDLLPTNLYTTGLLTGINTTMKDLCAITQPAKLELAPLLFQTGIFSIKNYDRVSDTYFLHYPNTFIAEYFEEKVFRTLVNPLGLELDYRSFGDKCNEMVGDLLKGDELHVREHFDQMNILAMERGYGTFPRNCSGRIMDETNRTLARQEYYFKIEGAYQMMMELCLDVTKVGRVRIERQFINGCGDIEFQIPKLAKTILYKMKAGAGNVKDAFAEQLLSKYAGTYLNQGRTLVCIAVSFNSKTRSLEDWVYAEYNEKGALQKFFSQKGYDVKTMNLPDISIS